MNDSSIRATSFAMAPWPAPPPEGQRCVAVFATVVKLDGEEVFLGAPSVEALERAFDCWVDGLAVFDRERVQRLVVTSDPDEVRP
jgi:hypothetical protein